MLNGEPCAWWQWMGPVRRRRSGSGAHEASGSGATEPVAMNHGLENPGFPYRSGPVSYTHLYTAIQSPAGDALAVRLAIISFTLGFAGLLIAEWLARRVRRWLGR